MKRITDKVEDGAMKVLELVFRGGIVLFAICAIGVALCVVAAIAIFILGALHII